MDRTYTTPEMQDLAVVAFLRGMAYAKTLTGYKKATARIAREHATLCLLNEQRRPVHTALPHRAAQAIQAYTRTHVPDVVVPDAPPSLIAIGALAYAVLGALIVIMIVGA
jgi:hypothetical protein